MSRHRPKNPVDMSLPVEQRHRRRQHGAIGGTPPAQMSYAAGSRAARERRDGERLMEISRRQQEDAERVLRDAAEVAVLTDEQFADRILARLPEEDRPAARELLRSICTEEPLRGKSNVMPSLIAELLIEEARDA